MQIEIDLPEISTRLQNFARGHPTSSEPCDEPPVRERGSVGRVQWCSEMVMTPVFLHSVANETCAIQSIQEWKTVTRCIENTVYTVPIPYPYRRELG